MAVKIPMGIFLKVEHVRAGMRAKLLQSCPALCDLMDCSLQAPLSMGFSRQEYWSGVPVRWLDGITKSMDMSLNTLIRDNKGQRSLACCTLWGRKESDKT